MARYIVRFMKDILGENGRQAEICQGLLEVEAANSRDATEIAKRKFCEKERLKEWSLHADRVNVAETEFPS
jgi:DNA-binding phage protein